MENKVSPLDVASALGILDQRPAPHPGKKYCNCDNPKHNLCYILVPLTQVSQFCEWCEDGCQRYKKEFTNTEKMV